VLELALGVKGLIGGGGGTRQPSRLVDRLGCGDGVLSCPAISAAACRAGSTSPWIR
jgi:hypothetical protein